MRRLIPFSAILLTSLAGTASVPLGSCANVHEGVFHMNGPDGSVTIIERDAQFQREINKKHHVELRYRVYWQDECTYKLTLDQKISGPAEFESKPGDTLTVRILSVNADGYHMVARSNFYEGVMNGTVLRGRK